MDCIREYFQRKLFSVETGKPAFHMDVSAIRAAVGTI